MNLNVFQTVDKALMKTFTPAERPQSVEDLWRQVAGNPAKILRLVKQKTGAEGTALIREALDFQRAMEQRYGN